MAEFESEAGTTGLAGNGTEKDVWQARTLIVEPEGTCSSGAHDRDCATAARTYLSRGWRPVPFRVHQRWPYRKRPLVEWGVYQNRQPSLEELEAWAKDGLFADGVGVVCGGGLMVVDADPGRPGFYETLLRLRATGAPEVLSIRGGAHFHFSGPDDVGTFATAAYEVKAEGALAAMPPTLGYRWLTPPGDALPVLPPELLTPQNQGQAAQGLECQVEAYQGLLGGRLHFSYATRKGRGSCPLHDDGVDSFSVYPGRTDGQLLWSCHADSCGKGGTLKELQRLCGAGEIFAEAWQRLRERVVEIPCLSEGARQLLDGVLFIGKQRALSPYDVMVMTYRALAEATGVETPGAAGRLSHRGQLIRRGLTEIRCAGLMAWWIDKHEGSAHPISHFRLRPELFATGA